MFTYGRNAQNLLGQQAMLSQAEPKSLMEDLQGQLRAAETNVARLQELIRLVKENPNTERILELLKPNLQGY